MGAASVTKAMIRLTSAVKGYQMPAAAGQRWEAAPGYGGTPEEAGHSVRGRVIAPEPDTDPLMHLIDWIR